MSQAVQDILDRIEHLSEEDRLRFSRRTAIAACARVARRAIMVEPGASRHQVPDDPADTPILRAALAASSDYLVTNDRHLLDLDPYEGVRIISMTAYRELLV